MVVLDTMQPALKTAAKVIKWGAGLQENTRKALVQELQTICNNCESAYDAILVRLVPIKNAYSNPDTLATELRALKADVEVRRKFKPEFLCGQVDHLLTQLGSNLNDIKYSIDMFRVQDVKMCLDRFGSVDGIIFQTYDVFVDGLDAIATQIPIQADRWLQRPRRTSSTLLVTSKDDMKQLKTDVRDTKNLIVGII